MLLLSGIVWDEAGPIAIINNEIFGVGDVIEGNTIVEIKKDRVILSDGTTAFAFTVTEEPLGTALTP